MTVDELLTALDEQSLSEEVFVRALDGDGKPMIMLVSGVTTDPNGLMIEAGEEIIFEAGAEAP